jgi:hypothetical protein
MKIRLLIPLLALAGCIPASADIFTLSSSLGVWSSATPPAAVTGIGTSQIRWGIPAGGTGQSGRLTITDPRLRRNPRNGDSPLVGTFVHHNQPITDTITAASRQSEYDGATNVIRTFAYD